MMDSRMAMSRSRLADPVVRHSTPAPQVGSQRHSRGERGLRQLHHSVTSYEIEPERRVFAEYFEAS